MWPLCYFTKRSKLLVTVTSYWELHPFCLLFRPTQIIITGGKLGRAVGLITGGALSAPMSGTDCRRMVSKFTEL